MKIMEVCGTHTVAIAKNGLRDVMPENVTLLSGPGCPVCVTANADIDMAIELARQPDVIVTTFGDMMKVPGSYSLAVAREGRRPRRPHRLLAARRARARREGARQAGRLHRRGLRDHRPAHRRAPSSPRQSERTHELHACSRAHKTVPEALAALVERPRGADRRLHPARPRLDDHRPRALPLPRRGVRRPERHHRLRAGRRAPGRLHAAKQIDEGAPSVEIAYRRGVVADEGNPTRWRAWSRSLRAHRRRLARHRRDPRHRAWPSARSTTRYDASCASRSRRRSPRSIKGCQCGEVLRGIIAAVRVQALRHGAARPSTRSARAWSPRKASCAAYYRYTDYGKGSSRAPACPQPDRTDPNGGPMRQDRILLAHGSGGTMMRELIEEVFVRRLRRRGARSAWTTRRRCGSRRPRSRSRPTPTS